MIGPVDDELLHQALDGALSPEEAERFGARVAADPAFGARAERLERLAEAMGGLGPEEPPAGFSDRVMAEVASVSPPRPAWHRRLASLPAAFGRQLFPWFAHRSEQGHHSSDSFRRAGMAGGGVIVAKKALWGVAGLAVVVILAVVYFNGTRTVDQGAQGAIGAASRYRAEPMSGKDVVLRDVAAQEFLQSDTWDRLLKDKNVRSMIGNPAVQAALANPAFCAALAQPGMAAALASPDFAKALASPDFRKALASPAMRAALQSAEFQAAMQSVAFQAALQSAGFQAALANPAVFQAALSAR